MSTFTPTLLSFLILINNIYAVIVEDIQGTNDTITCNQDSNICSIFCNGESSCGNDNDVGIGSQPEIHCPTGGECELCYLECQGAGACAGSTIYGYNCSELEIELKGPRAGKRLRIYAPSNNGDLKLNIKRGPNCSLESEVYSSPGTNNMYIDCKETSSVVSAGQCKNMKIDAKNAKYASFNCIDGSDCDSSEFYCPLTSASDYYAIHGKPGCKLNCTNSQDCGIDIFINDNTYDDDIDVICDGECNSGNEDPQIYCDENYYQHCDIKQLNSSTSDEHGFGYDWICEGECQPIAQPTQYPSLPPSWMIMSQYPTNSGGDSDEDAESVLIDESWVDIWFNMTGSTTDWSDIILYQDDDEMSLLEKILSILMVPFVLIPMLICGVCCVIGGTQNIYFNCQPRSSALEGGAIPLSLKPEKSRDIVILE